MKNILNWFIAIISTIGTFIIIYAIIKAPNGDVMNFTYAGLIFGLISIALAAIFEIKDTNEQSSVSTELNLIKSQLDKIKTDIEGIHHIHGTKQAEIL